MPEDRPLHYAALAGQADLARLLVDAGADPWGENCFTETPLQVARHSPAAFLGVDTSEVRLLHVTHLMSFRIISYHVAILYMYKYFRHLSCHLSYDPVRLLEVIKFLSSKTKPIPWKTAMDTFRSFIRRLWCLMRYLSWCLKAFSGWICGYGGQRTEQSSPLILLTLKGRRVKLLILATTANLRVQIFGMQAQNIFS